MKFLHIVATAAGLLTLFLQADCVQAQTKWVQIQPPGAGFRIEFPGQPAITKDSVPSRAGPAPHLEAKLSYADNEYLVELTTYASASDPEAILGLYSSTAAKMGQVRRQASSKIRADSARRFEIEVQAKFFWVMLVVTDGTRVYQIMCLTSKGKEHSADVTHFINSFALVQL